jgi:hypothetical protein
MKIHYFIQLILLNLVVMKCSYNYALQSVSAVAVGHLLLLMPSDKKHVYVTVKLNCKWPNRFIISDHFVIQRFSCSCTART